jgi:hypothetical protein
MYASLTIVHRELTPAEVKARLASVYGDDDPSALARSPLYTAHKHTWSRAAIFSADHAGYRVICLRNTSEELQLHIESIARDLRESCEAAWRALDKGMATDSPELRNGEILDPTNGRTLLSMVPGSTFLKNREILQALLTGIVSVVLLVVGAFTFAEDSVGDLAIGTLPAIIGMLVILGTSLIGTGKGVIEWK